MMFVSNLETSRKEDKNKSIGQWLSVGEINVMTDDSNAGKLPEFLQIFGPA